MITNYSVDFSYFFTFYSTDYIGSFVDELSELHNFTLKSQWLYQLDFDFEVRDVSLIFLENF